VLSLCSRSITWIASGIDRGDTSAVVEMRHMGRRGMVQCVVYDEASLKTGVFLAFMISIYLIAYLYGLPMNLIVTDGHLLLVISICT
jgi:hypothetical protein